jgi:pimeloyl-ACP methyl ester carboxylesterase
VPRWVFMIGLVLLAVIAIIGAGVGITAFATRRIEAAHPPSGRFVEVDGGRLHVLELGPKGQGAGRVGGEGAGGAADPYWPVVLVHGASGNLGDLRFPLGDRLAQTRRVILVDRPGHGWSDRPGGAQDASPARQAALIAQALERIGLERFVLLGHSLGGAVATAFALAFPDRLAGLVLLAPVTHPWSGGLSWYNALLTTPLAGVVFAHALALPAGEFLLEGGAASVFAPQAIPPAYLRRAGIRLLLRPSEFIANAQDVAILKGFVTAQVPRYRDIAVPTVVLTGDADVTVWPQIHARAIATALPDARLVILPGIGHMPQHVATDEVIAAIDSVAAKRVGKAVVPAKP